MLLVAAAALILAGERAYRHVSHCRSRAAWHAWAETAARERAAHYELEEVRLGVIGRDRTRPEVRYAVHEAEFNRERAADHARLRRLFERAAFRPWLPISTEPAEAE